MADWLAEHGASIVVCAGYMQLLTPAFLRRFPENVINIHPSLLPALGVVWHGTRVGPGQARWGRAAWPAGRGTFAVAALSSAAAPTGAARCRT